MLTLYKALQCIVPFPVGGPRPLLAKLCGDMTLVFIWQPGRGRWVDYERDTYYICIIVKQGEHELLLGLKACKQVESFHVLKCINQDAPIPSLRVPLLYQLGPRLWHNGLAGAEKFNHHLSAATFICKSWGCTSCTSCKEFFICCWEASLIFTL